MAQIKLRGDKCDDLVTALKASEFYRFYKQHKHELILCVRHNEIHIYYACDRIAKIKCVNNKLTFKINEYYMKGKGYDNEKLYTESDIIKNYDNIKKNSERKNKREKQAQQQLFINNNSNPKSNWFCVDVEYVKAYASQTDKDDDEGGCGRFDIIAISKSKPTIACYELKYGKVAFGGNSGLKKHIDDFSTFKLKGYCKSQLNIEVAKIINVLQKLGEPIPNELQNITSDDIQAEPKFFFAVLDCKARTKKYIETTPYGELAVQFLFSADKLPRIEIKDIIDDKKWVAL